MKLAATAIVIALTAIQPASAALEFGFVAAGPVALNTGNINPATATATYPGAFVNIADTANGIYLFDTVSLSGPFELIDGAINLTVSVASYDFWFNEAERGNFVFTGPGAGSFAMQYTGPDVTASQSCDQVKPGGIVNCSDVLVKKTHTQIPEPTTMTLLGGALLGLGLLGRRRRANA